MYKKGKHIPFKKIFNVAPYRYLTHYCPAAIEFHTGKPLFMTQRTHIPLLKTSVASYANSSAVVGESRGICPLQFLFFTYRSKRLSFLIDG